MSNGCSSSFWITTTQNIGSYMWDTGKKLSNSTGLVEVTPGSNYKISISTNSVILESKDTFSITD